MVVEVDVDALVGLLLRWWLKRFRRTWEVVAVGARVGGGLDAIDRECASCTVLENDMATSVIVLLEEHQEQQGRCLRS